MGAGAAGIHDGARLSLDGFSAEPALVYRRRRRSDPPAAGTSPSSKVRSVSLAPSPTPALDALASVIAGGDCRIRTRTAIHSGREEDGARAVGVINWPKRRRYRGARLLPARMSSAVLGTLLVLALAIPPALARSLQKGKEYSIPNALFCIDRSAIDALVKLRRDAVYNAVPAGCDIGAVSQFVPQYRLPMVSFQTVIVVSAPPERDDHPCTDKQTLEIRYCRVLKRGVVAGYATQNDGQIILLYLEVPDDVEVDAVERLDGAAP
jgi:hypothetical protein